MKIIPRLTLDSCKDRNRSRRLYEFRGFPFGDSTLGVNNTDIKSLYKAIAERLFKCKIDGIFQDPLVTDSERVNNYLGIFQRKLNRIIGTLTPSSHLEVVNSYKGRRKTIYEKAYMSLLCKPVQKKDAYSIQFQKVEKIDTKKIPRCISPRNPRYNLELGRYLKLAEHKILRCIDRVFGYTVVGKGYNVRQLGKIVHDHWSQFRDPVCVVLDGVKFDAHVNEHLLRWEHQIYLNAYRNCRFLAKLLGWQINNVGFAVCYDGVLKFFMKGRRYSGDMNTSLGNITIMLGWVYRMLLDIDLLTRTRVLNNGDDTIVFMERSDLQKFLAHITPSAATIGLRIRVDYVVDVIEKVRFCQMAPIYTPTGYVMQRDYYNVIAKDVLSTHNLLDRKTREAWMYAVGYGGLAMSGEMPILRNMYYSYLRFGRKTNFWQDPELMKSAFFYWGRGLVPYFSRIEPETRLSFYVAFGVTPDEQTSLEAWFDKVDLYNIVQD